MSDKNRLHFHSEHDAIVLLEKLKKGHTTVGRWTLEQASWHLSRPLLACLHEPATAEPTPEQAAAQEQIDGLIAAGGMPDGMDMPPGTEPPADPPAGSVDEFIAGLHDLAAYPHARVDFLMFGPVEIAKFRDFIRIHSAHHLKRFAPTT